MIIIVVLVFLVALTVYIIVQNQKDKDDVVESINEAESEIEKVSEEKEENN